MVSGTNIRRGLVILFLTGGSALAQRQETFAERPVRQEVVARPHHRSVRKKIGYGRDRAGLGRAIKARTGFPKGFNVYNTAPTSTIQVHRKRPATTTLKMERQSFKE